MSDNLTIETYEGFGAKGSQLKATKNMSLSHLLFSFRGRIGRAKFWLATVILTIVAVSSWFLFLRMGDKYFARFDGRFDSLSDTELAIAMVPGLMLLVHLMALVSQCAVGAKRCHDRGKSGWFQLMLLIPLIGAVWWVIDLGILEGDRGKNRFD